jgi:hypothetical protein
MPRTQIAMTTRARVLTPVLALALSVSVGACGLKSCFSAPTDESKSCDLDRRLFETAGASSTELSDASIPGTRLFRYKRNRDLTYASVVGCKPSTGEVLQPDEVFELLPHGGGSAEELAALHTWCFHEGGLAGIAVVRTAERFALSDGNSDPYTPPTKTLGVLSFWQEETDTLRHPVPWLDLIVVDSRTGLGGDRRYWSGAGWPKDHTFLASALTDEKRRGVAFFLLAYRPRHDLAKDLVLSLLGERDPQERYLGLMGLRGEVGVEQVEAVARLADNDAPPLVRMGVVQTLATIPAVEARPLAAAILQRETDPRAHRVMEASLKD